MQQQILDFLNLHSVGVLATISEEQTPQAATVFFICDNSGGLIFKSRSTSAHMLTLRRNSSAALAVYDHSSNYNVKSGVQLLGDVSRIKEEDRMQEYVEQYGQKFAGSLQKFAPLKDLLSSDASSTLFRFQVERYKFTDSKAGRADTEYQVW